MKQNQEGTRRSSAGNVLAIGFLISSISLAACTKASSSEQAGWLTEHSASRVTKAMEKKGLMPATIDCRYSRNGPVNLSKFTWKRAAANSIWRWYVGPPNYVASNEVGARAIGLHRVFSKKARDRATGQTVQCSIWTN